MIVTAVTTRAVTKTIHHCNCVEAQWYMIDENSYTYLISPFLPALLHSIQSLLFYPFARLRIVYKVTHIELSCVVWFWQICYSRKNGGVLRIVNQLYNDIRVKNLVGRMTEWWSVVGKVEGEGWVCWTEEGKCEEKERGKGKWESEREERKSEDEAEAEAGRQSEEYSSRQAGR